jgi:hypothetical protein
MNEFMQNKKPSKILRLAVLLSASALAFLANVQRSVTAMQDPPARLFEIAGVDQPLERRIGVDDGAAFVVHFAGDTHGSLDTCG